MAETFWDRLRRMLQRDKRDASAALADATRRGNAVLDEKERELAATPEERLQIQQQRAAQANDDFEAIKRQIEGRSD